MSDPASRQDPAHPLVARITQLFPAGRSGELALSAGASLERSTAMRSSFRWKCTARNTAGRSSTRFPLPFAAVEGSAGGQLRTVALHPTPSPIRFGHRPDQWWSLGLEYRDDGSVELAAYSGPVASNGRNATIKGHQRTWHDYDHAWCTLPPRAVVEKTFPNCKYCRVAESSPPDFPHESPFPLVAGSRGAGYVRLRGHRCQTASQHRCHPRG